MVSIYGLYHPITGELRYVGKTEKALFRRLAQHMYNARKGGTTYRDCWIRKLIEQGLKPTIQLIESTTQADWSEREQFWIREKSKDGRLTNLHEGGPAGSMLSRRGINNHKVVYTSEQVRQAVTLYILGCSYKQIITLEPFTNLKWKTLRGWAEKENRVDETLGLPFKSQYQRESKSAL